MGEAEAGATRVVGIYPDASAETLDDELADGEAQAAALRVLVMDEIRRIKEKIDFTAQAETDRRS